MIALVFLPVIAEAVVIAATVGVGLYAYWYLSNQTDFMKFDRANGGLDGQSQMTWNGNFYTLPPEYRTWKRPQRYQWYLDNVAKTKWHKQDIWWKQVWNFIQSFWWLLLILIILLKYAKK